LRPPAVCILYKPRETPPPELPLPGGTVYEGLFFTATESRAYRKERIPLPEALERIEKRRKSHRRPHTQFCLLYHRVCI
jgi:hypothetical protein